MFSYNVDDLPATHGGAGSFQLIGGVMVALSLIMFMIFG